LLRSKTKNWKRIKRKEANKFMRNFRLNMRNGSETNTVSLWSETGAPYWGHTTLG
jgi:hypothetical protein